VSISINDNNFTVIEYVNLGLQNTFKYYPLEKTTIRFENNGSYTINTKLLFKAPQFDKRTLHHIYNTNNALLEKLKKGLSLTKNEILDLKNLPATYLICYLNLFDEAKNKLNEAKPYLKAYSSEIYRLYKESIRILRKVKYS
jgi:DNA polymerase III delta subunit